MDYLYTVLLTILSLGVILCVIAFIKNEITYKNHMIINNAIGEYNRSKAGVRKESDCNLYACMESYDNTFYRINDWGYENILPRDKMDIIRPYIKDKKEKK